VITASGGACDIIADRASEHGIEIPPFSEQTAAAITPHLPPFGAARNPLDVTGYILANQRTSALTAVDHALDAAVSDPGLDFVVFSGLTLPEAGPPDEALAQLQDERVAWLGQRISSAPVPVITMGPTCVDISPYARELLGRQHIHVLGGMELGLRAIAHGLRWAERRGTVQAGLLARPPAPPASSPWPQGSEPIGPGLNGGRGAAAAEPGVSWSEARARSLLAAAGVPLVPGELAHSADEAADLASELGLPVALKICSAQITHKSDIGGVALSLRTPQEVRAAYARVRAAGDQVAGASIEGVLVTPMRTGGAELLAGITVDPAFGPVLAVGLGGIWVEILADTSLRVLPADAGEIRRMLAELRGIALLTGARGGVRADLAVVAEVIARVGAAALSLNGSLRALEVNPLWVHGDQVEALDVLVVTGTELS
jgi:acyl-CoA synthetase (NDP forming)